MSPGLDNYQREVADRAEVRMIERLMQMPDAMFKKIKATVDGENPIVVNLWMGVVDGELCGCLLCDNITRERKDAAENVFGYSEIIQQMLAEFYGVEDTYVTYDSSIATHFDTWAWGDRITKASQTGNPDDDYTTTVVSEKGRAELREIFARVAAGRPA